MTPLNLSSEAQELLKEILAHENDTSYWENRFNVLSKKDDAIIRGCFKELKDNEMIKVLWGDNIPIHIHVLKDGYSYESPKSNSSLTGIKKEQFKHMNFDKILGLSETLKINTTHPCRFIEPQVVEFIKQNLLSIITDFEKEYPVLIEQIKKAQDKLFYKTNFNISMNPISVGRILATMDIIYEIETGKANNIWVYVHPKIIKSSKKLYLDGYYSNASLDAFKEINGRMKNLYKIIKTEEKKIPDGTKLMNDMLSDQNPILPIDDISTTTGKDIQSGFRFMFSGAISALRNPSAHSNDEKLTAEESMRRLMFASMLMYKIDEALKINKICE